MPRFKSEIYHQCFNILFPEIGKVRGNLFQINGYVKEPLILPEGSGPPVIHSEKVYVPVKEHPDVSILILFYLSNILFLLIFFIIKQYNLSLVIFIAFFQDAAIYVYFKYYRYCPSEIPNVEFFNGIKVPIHSGNQKASSRG